MPKAKNYFVQAFTFNGDYIGDIETADLLTEKYGISPELAHKKHKVCSIGYSEKHKAWFGWSHRAISKFKTRAEAVKFAESVS